MQAVILDGFGAPLALREIPDPVAGPGEVVIRVKACGVCHSDLHLADGDWDLLKRITKLPLVLGHEVTGVVESAGPDSGFAPGDRVGVPWLHWTCGMCEYCTTGRETLCGEQKITGVTVDGGFAEFVKAPASHTARIPDGISLEDAAPLFCAGLTVYKALKSSGIESGQTLAVFGVGGLGHLAVQIAKARGVRVAALDIAEDKLALARECGADLTVDLRTGQARKALRPLGGAHVAIVCSGAKAAYESALTCLRKGGTLVVVGMPAEPISVSAVTLVAGEYRIIASAVGTREDLRELLDLAAAGGIRCRVETAPLSEAGAALERMRNGAITGRVVLTPLVS
ncbi:MAG: zinc-dependent alcohol dehydrogenase [Acidobacteria bacterium]|nr:zinc-dependent alcohol dehydrogenase [Acidobacteriota bacterium]